MPTTANAPALRARRPLTARRVRRARRLLETDRCPAAPRRIRHTWIFDGYFWHRCQHCRTVS